MLHCSAFSLKIHYKKKMMATRSQHGTMSLLQVPTILRQFTPRLLQVMAHFLHHCKPFKVITADN